jgi:predicted DNA-binding transcriptional regulator YafY
MERDADGSLIVRFRAGGVQEMCWHLFTWGTVVQIVAPDTLRVLMIETGIAVAKHHSTRMQQKETSR